MVKTTVNLNNEIYKSLVKEAVAEYGTTKVLSRLINEKLKTVRVGRSIDIVKMTAGIWKIKESGCEYTKRIRSESEKRLK